MTMNVVTEVYAKSAALLTSPSLHADWQDIEAGLKSLLQADGPAVDDLRDRLRKRSIITGKIRSSGCAH